MSKSAQIILIGLAFCMLFHVESKSMKIRKKRDADNSADTPSFLNELANILSAEEKVYEEAEKQMEKMPGFKAPDLSALPGNYSNSTSEIKEINGTLYQTNQTIYKHAGTQGKVTFVEQSLSSLGDQNQQTKDTQKNSDVDTSAKVDQRRSLKKIARKANN